MEIESELIFELNNLGSDKESEIDDIITLFTKACKENKLEIAQWIYSTVTDKELLNEHNEYEIKELFEHLCLNGLLEVAQWIYSIYHSSFFNKEVYDYEYIFVFSVLSNQFSVAQWLLSIQPDIDILSMSGDVRNNNIIKYICDKRVENNIDSLRQLEFLYSLNNEYIMENMKNIFSQSIVGNKINILQWCVEKNPKIVNKSTLQKIFTFSAENKYIDVVHWIHTKILTNIIML